MILTPLACALGVFASSHPEPAMQDHGSTQRGVLTASDIIPRGEELLSDLGCIQCHAPSDAARARLDAKSAPDLSAAGKRLNPKFVRAYLNDPQAAQPGATMPHLLAYMDAPSRDRAVDELVHFIASLGGDFNGAPFELTAGEVEEGRQLFHEVGCVACHTPLESPDDLTYTWWELEDRGSSASDAPADDDDEPRRVMHTKGHFDAEAPGLEHLGLKTSLGPLVAFLRDPLSVRPSGRMPSLNLKEKEARAIAAYLLRGQAEAGGKVNFPGLAYDYYEHTFNGKDDWSKLTVKRTGIVANFGLEPKHRGNNIGFRFTGMLEVKSKGKYHFFTTSDDGSYLSINGRQLVDNGGSHGMQTESGEVELNKGSHAIDVTFYQGGGGLGLKVEWEGPGIKRGQIAPDLLSHMALSYQAPVEAGFKVDAVKAKAGRSQFMSLGCVQCHALPEQAGDPGPRFSGAPLAELHGDTRNNSTGSLGCLAEKARFKSAHYVLSDEDRAALLSTLKARANLEKPLAADTAMERKLATMNCYACHRRGEIGGPTPDRNDYFYTVGEVDLGDEGRLPPPLSRVGYKLTEDWMRKVLIQGQTQRPYMATRMPQFGKANIEHLVPDFIALDRRGPKALAAPFNPALLEEGRKLVGTGGMGCIQCHTLGGYDSLGVPAVDLAEMSGRVTKAWFRDYLSNPMGYNPGTRMPEFWGEDGSTVKTVLDGNQEKQIEAIWGYLSMGHSMPLPEGLVVPAATYELVARDRPIQVGVFMKGVSPRVIMVGFPLHLHYAFDMEHTRLAKVWRGRFFNARGTWNGRAGALESPPSPEVTDMPDGGALVRLTEASAEWPEVEYKNLGRTFDSEGIPTVHYSLGNIVIAETIVPIMRSDGVWMRRSFHVTAPKAVDDLWLRIADAERCEEGAPMTWRSSDGGGKTYNWVLSGDVDASVQKQGKGAELRARVIDWKPSDEGHEARFAVEMNW